MTDHSQLFLLADHIKLLLLERQRATTLNLDDDAQDGQISRSLDQLRTGLASIWKEKVRHEHEGNEEYDESNNYHLVRLDGHSFVDTTFSQTSYEFSKATLGLGATIQPLDY